MTPRPQLTPRKDPVPIVQEAGWASGAVWTGAENLGPTGIRSPDRPARRQLLYRVRYPDHRYTLLKTIFSAGLACGLPGVLRNGKTSQNKDWKSRLHVGRRH